MLRPFGGRRRLPLVAAAFEALLLGLAISILAGAAAGTAIIPVVGTAFGAVVGAYVGIVPTVIGTVAVVVLVAMRHRPLRDPRVLHRDLWIMFLWIEGAVALLALLLGGIYAAREWPWGSNALLAALWVFGGPFIVDALLLTWLLRRTAWRLTLSYARRSGWITVGG